MLSAWALRHGGSRSVILGPLAAATSWRIAEYVTVVAGGPGAGPDRARLQGGTGRAGGAARRWREPRAGRGSTWGVPGRVVGAGGSAPASGGALLERQRDRGWRAFAPQLPHCRAGPSVGEAGGNHRPRALESASSRCRSAAWWRTGSGSRACLIVVGLPWPPRSPSACAGRAAALARALAGGERQSCLGLPPGIMMGAACRARCDLSTWPPRSASFYAPLLPRHGGLADHRRRPCATSPATRPCPYSLPRGSCLATIAAVAVFWAHSRGARRAV